MKTGNFAESLHAMSKNSFREYRLRLEALIREACHIINRVKTERDQFKSEVNGIKETSVT